MKIHNLGTVPAGAAPAGSGTGFRLTKWYADAVGRDGEVFVGHQARLEWRGLSLRHASVLCRSADGTVRERWASRDVREPEADGAGVRWRSRRPGVEGAWDGPVDGTAHRLFEAGPGAVDWTCLVPSAAARVVLPDGRLLRGRGYAERLEMTVRPWRLPVAELRWGRFAGEEESLVWVEWRGPAPMSLALLNGRPAPVDSIGEGSVVLGRGLATLSLSIRATLREGRLGESVLDRIPGLCEVLPVRALRLHETRWLSRGVLETARGRSEGDVLHELVRWP